MSRSLSSNALLGVIDDIPISKLKVPRNPLRSSLQNVNELIDSIRQRGLLQPIVVRGSGDYYYEIIAGNRRYEACKRLSWRKITCHIVELDDKESFELSLIENVQRETLNAVDEARAFKTYVSDFGWGGVSELARKIGKTPSYVSKRIALLNLPHDVIQAVADSIVRPSVADELSTIKDHARQSELAYLIARRHLSLRSVRELIDQADQDEYIQENRSYYIYSEDRRKKIQRAFDKSITALKIALDRMSMVIDDIEDDDNWACREILLQHKNVINNEINILLKEKRKCGQSIGLDHG